MLQYGIKMKQEYLFLENDCCLLDLFYPLAVVNLFDEIIRFACSNVFTHLGFPFAGFLATVLS